MLPGKWVENTLYDFFLGGRGGEDFFFGGGGGKGSGRGYVLLGLGMELWASSQGYPTPVHVTDQNHIQVIIIII